VRSNDRFHANSPHFGGSGLAKLRRTRCAVVGVGDLGTQVVQQLAFLGIGSLILVANDDLDGRNPTGFVRSRHSNSARARDVELAARLANEIDPSIEVCTTHENIGSRPGFNAVVSADYVFGCLNFEGVRYYLNDLCSSFGRPYIDLAVDSLPPDSILRKKSAYRGRVLSNYDGNGCLVCMGLLDEKEAGRDSEREILLRRRDVICLDHFAENDASLTPIRSVIASLAVTEFMAHVTGVRPARRLLIYDGRTSGVTVNQRQPLPNCSDCATMRGKRAAESSG